MRFCGLRVCIDKPGSKLWAWPCQMMLYKYESSETESVGRGGKADVPFSFLLSWVTCSPLPTISAPERASYLIQSCIQYMQHFRESFLRSVLAIPLHRRVRLYYNMKQCWFQDGRVGGFGWLGFNIEKTLVLSQGKNVHFCLECSWKTSSTLVLDHEPSSWSLRQCHAVEPQHSEWEQSAKMHCRRALLSRRKAVDTRPEQSSGSQKGFNIRRMSPLQDLKIGQFAHKIQAIPKCHIL